MLDDPYTLDLSRAQMVLVAIPEVCTFRDWEVLAAHVRSTHIHCVVDGLVFPNRAIGDFKAHASRALNRIEGCERRWARGGNALSLRTRRAIHAAVGYVADGQGEAMAVYVRDGDCTSPTREGGDNSWVVT
jgi:REP element-mobilizing transposase RayT